MNSVFSFFGAAALALQVSCSPAPAAAQEEAPAAGKPNVIMIVMDDLNDWVDYMANEPGGGPPAAAGSFTPNIDRLVSSGVAFTRAYPAAPICTSSRAAFLGGRRPGFTGEYDLNHDWAQAFKLRGIVPITKQFMANGYTVSGFGKVYHPQGATLQTFFTTYSAGSGGGGGKGLNLNKLNAGADDWGSPPAADTDPEMLDYRNASAAIAAINSPHPKPFFIAYGEHSPHLPMYGPRKYFDRFPLSAALEPPVLATDLTDLPAAGKQLAARSGFQNPERISFAELKASGKWPAYLQAYLAMISFGDAQVGRILDALNASPYGSNTIVVLFGDHGYRLGEKGLHKAVLWERMRTPLVFSGPGIARGARVAAPVDLMAIYPTLAALAGVPAPSSGFDGVSLAALLKNPTAAAPLPYALTTYWDGKGHAVHSVRGPRYRLIAYADGSIEFYDEQTDPNEWTNLAATPAGVAKYAVNIAALRKYVPVGAANNRPPVRIFGKAGAAAPAEE
jgi:arylsulfatase A-like enzyme